MLEKDVEISYARDLWFGTYNLDNVLHVVIFFLTHITLCDPAEMLFLSLLIR